MHLLGSDDGEHQRVYNDASDEDTLHLGVILHDHGLAILDNRRLQVISSSYMIAR